MSEISVKYFLRNYYTNIENSIINLLNSDAVEFKRNNIDSINMVEDCCTIKIDANANNNDYLKYKKVISSIIYSLLFEQTDICNTGEESHSVNTFELKIDNLDPDIVLAIKETMIEILKKEIYTSEEDDNELEKWREMQKFEIRVNINDLHKSRYYILSVMIRLTFVVLYTIAYLSNTRSFTLEQVKEFMKQNYYGRYELDWGKLKCQK